MIHYYCDGSYKEEEKTVGCGIVRVDKKDVRSISKSTNYPYWFNKQEEFAIYQTLLLIEKNEDRHVVIWNDYSSLITMLPKKKNNKKWRERLKVVIKKLSQLKMQGYNISFQWKTEELSEYIELAHSKSREYLNKKTERKTETTKEQTNQKHLAPRSMNGEEEEKLSEIAKERKILRDNAKEMGVGKKINKKLLWNSNQIYFKKISNKNWCVFNEKEEPIYIHEDIAKMIYDVTKEVLRCKKIVKIQDSSKHLFSSVLNTKNIRKKYSQMITRIEQWEEENRIEFVS